MENLEELKNDTLTKIRAAANLKELDEIRVAVLGKKGKLTEQMKGLGALPLEEKIAAGKALNVIKNEIDAAITKQKSVLEEKALNEKLASETIDVTLPVRPETQGRIHPVSKIYEEKKIFIPDIAGSGCLTADAGNHAGGSQARYG